MQWKTLLQWTLYMLNLKTNYKLQIYQSYISSLDTELTELYTVQILLSFNFTRCSWTYISILSFTTTVRSVGNVWGGQKGHEHKVEKLFKWQVNNNKAKIKNISKAYEEVRKITFLQFSVQIIYTVIILLRTI